MPNRHPLTTLLRPCAYAARVTDRADADARAAGLTVEVLAGGVRRYRDPRLDQLAAHRASQLPVNPPAAAADAIGRRRGSSSRRGVVTVTRHPSTAGRCVWTARPHCTSTRSPARWSTSGASRSVEPAAAPTHLICRCCPPGRLRRRQAHSTACGGLIRCRGRGGTRPAAPHQAGLRKIVPRRLR